MICPECLAEYNFVRLELDKNSLLSKGVFRCDCPLDSIFDESEMHEEGLLDDELAALLKNSKLMLIRDSLSNSKSPKAELAKALTIGLDRLARYVEIVSQRPLE